MAAAVPTSYRSSHPGCSAFRVLDGHERDQALAVDGVLDQL